MKKLSLCAAALLASLSTAQAIDITTSGNWDNPTIWGGTKPSTPITSAVVIRNNATVTMSSTDTLAARLTIGTSTNQRGNFVVTSGANMTISDRLYVGDRNGTGLASMTVSGGKLTLTGGSNGNFWVGNGQTTLSGSGILRVTGGEILFSGTTATLSSFTIGTNNNSSVSSSIATYSQTGGTVSGVVGLAVANNATVASDYSISSQVALMGGTFSISGGISAGNNSTNATGAHIAVTISSNMDTVHFGSASVFAGADTKLIFDVAQRDNWTGKTILTIGNALTVNGAAGVVVDLSDFGLWTGANVGDTVTITLAQYTSLSKTSSTADTITGLDTDHFSASNITWGSTAATIDVTYTNAIPEPAVAAGALGLLALAVAVRRRRI